MTSVVEVILTHDRRGLGTPDDPVRLVPQLWTKDGNLICEVDRGTYVDHENMTERGVGDGPKCFLDRLTL